MVVNVVLVAVGLGLIVVSGVARNREAVGRRLDWSEVRAERMSPRRMVGLLGFLLVVWGDTQLQTKFFGGWAWLVLIPLALAVWLPVALHNRAISGRTGSSRAA